MKSSYQIWIEGGGSKKIQLPVNPEEISISADSDNQTADIIGLGETTILGTPKPKTISFSSFFPAKYFPGCSVSKPIIPHYYINMFLEFQKSKVPVRLYITKCDIIWYVTIEKFSYSQKGGDVGSYNYSITLKQYRISEVRQVKVRNNKAYASKTKTSRASTMQKPKTYTTVSGDTLYNIAKKFYSNGNDYMKIYNANKSIIGANPNDLDTDVTLVIP